MKRFIIEEVKLDKEHPLWPSEIVYKIFDTKLDKYRYGCYTTPESALHYMDILNDSFK